MQVGWMYLPTAQSTSGRLVTVAWIFEAVEQKLSPEDDCLAG